jgi:hypothetical protein
MAEPKPAEPLVLSVNCIHDGRFYAAGTATPYTSEADLPLAMKGFIASEATPAPFDPSVRNIYGDMTPAARRQVRQLELAAAEREWFEEQAAEPLPEDVQAALEDSHAAYIARLKAEAEYDGKLADTAFQAAQPAPPPQLYVRRGGEWGHVERAKLKPAEHVFVRRENGQMESVGVVDSNGQPPPPEITF